MEFGGKIILVGIFVIAMIVIILMTARTFKFATEAQKK